MAPIYIERDRERERERERERDVKKLLMSFPGNSRFHGSWLGMGSSDRGARGYPTIREQGRAGPWTKWEMALYHVQTASFRGPSALMSRRVGCGDGAVGG